MFLRKTFLFLLALFVVCLLQYDLPLIVEAQDPVTITGTLTSGKITGMTITFPPAGGHVTGSWQTEDYLATIYTIEGEEIPSCYGTQSLVLNGEFAGGDGGEVSGDATWVLSSPGCLEGEFTVTWSGIFYANGTGSGVFEETSIEEYGPFEWSVTFSAEEFAAALPLNVTAEYIYNTYGITVEDSFGDDRWAKKMWTDRELVLLNDVLKDLPPSFLKNLSISKIIRNEVKINEDGTQSPRVMGTYYSCNRKIDPDCNGSSSCIRIYDSAAQPSSFPGDAEKEFKATILHELTHAYQYHNVDGGTYKNIWQSPQVQEYQDATRSDRTENASDSQNGWGFYIPPGEWQLWNSTSNHQPPTQYGQKNPLEDMSESVKMYVYNPDLLKQNSIIRYNYIRDYMFGGVEYGKVQ